MAAAAARLRPCFRDPHQKYVEKVPPGVKFDPEDEELIQHYLMPKINRQTLPPILMHEIDMYNSASRFDPDYFAAVYTPQRVGKWYYFTPRDPKYSDGIKPAGEGYWKASGDDKRIYCGCGKQVGFRMTLAFYWGKPNHGIESNWIMHEYKVYNEAGPSRPSSSHGLLDEWVLCKIFKRIDDDDDDDDDDDFEEEEE